MLSGRVGVGSTEPRRQPDVVEHPDHPWMTAVILARVIRIMTGPTPANWIAPPRAPTSPRTTDRLQYGAGRGPAQQKMAGIPNQ